MLPLLSGSFFFFFFFLISSIFTTSTSFGAVINDNAVKNIINNEFNTHNVIQHLVSSLEHVISRDSNDNEMFRPIQNDTRKREIFDSIIKKFSFNKVDPLLLSKDEEDEEEYYKYIDGVNKLCPIHTEELFNTLIEIHDFIHKHYRLTDELYFGLPRGLVYSNIVLKRLLRESGKSLKRD